MKKAFNRNDGFTLVELIVAMAMAVIVTAAAPSVLLLGLRVNRQTADTASQQITVRTLLTTVENSASARFIPLDTPRFYDLEATVHTSASAAIADVLPAVGNEDFYRITLTGECEPVALDSLKAEFTQFPNLELRDKTQPPADLWVAVGNDSLEGVYFGMLKEAMEGQDEDSARIAMLAAKISRKILDGGEVVLP
jgi:prepilin-type N-terminal cleavage/methylation domain-containing protein